MNDISDIQLIKDIRSNQCSECIDELKNRHIGLIIQIYSQFSSALNNLNFKSEDFHEELRNIIYISAKNFDLRRKRIKFSSYLASNIRYFCLNQLTKLKKNKSVDISPEKITFLIDEYYSDNNSHDSKNKEMHEYIFEILNQISDQRMRRIFEMRYMCDGKMTFKDIGKKMNLTSQSIINLHNKGLKFLKSKILSKNISDTI